MRKVSIFNHIKGQSLVEFVLIVPILLLLVFGTIDFSRVAYNKTLVNQYTKEIARKVSVGKSINSIGQDIGNMVEPMTGSVTTNISVGKDELGKDCTTIIFTPSKGYSMTVYITPRYLNTLNKGETMRIYAMYKTDYITPILSVFGNTIQLKSTYYTTLEDAPA